MAKRKSNAGRPPKITPEVLRKLEEAFALGCTDVEACLFADISKTTLYKYQDEHPEFADRKEALKENPVLLARTSVVKALPNDSDLALKYLERKRKDEFSTKQVQDQNINTKLEDATLEELEAELERLRKEEG